MKSKLPDLSYEKKLWEKDFVVMGIDEVGRGSFAGPLMVGAVCFKSKLNNIEIKKLESYGINDSKKLSPKQRENLAKIVKNRALFHQCVSINVATIDKIGIGGATQKAAKILMKKMLKKTSGEKLFVLIDAFYVKYVHGVGLVNQKAIIHGDEKSISIAAASIIAKVKRDKLMKKLSRQFPNYNWDKNKGYGTLDHRNAIKKYGKTDLHRKAFIRKIQ